MESLACKECGRLFPTQEISALEEQWKHVLHCRGAPRPLYPGERSQLEQAVTLYGQELCSLALLGAQHEQGFDGFDPSNFLSLRRIFNPEKVENFFNIGARVREREKRAAHTAARVKASEMVNEPAPSTLTPEEVKAKIASIFKRM